MTRELSTRIAVWIIPHIFLHTSAFPLIIQDSRYIATTLVISSYSVHPSHAMIKCVGNECYWFRTADYCWRERRWCHFGVTRVALFVIGQVTRVAALVTSHQTAGVCLVPCINKALTNEPFKNTQAPNELTKRKRMLGAPAKLLWQPPMCVFCVTIGLCFLCIYCTVFIKYIQIHLRNKHIGQTDTYKATIVTMVWCSRTKIQWFYSIY